MPDRQLGTRYEALDLVDEVELGEDDGALEQRRQHLALEVGRVDGDRRVVVVPHGRRQERVRHRAHEQDRGGAEPVREVEADLVQHGQDEGDVEPGLGVLYERPKVFVLKRFLVDLRDFIKCSIEDAEFSVKLPHK